MNRIARTLSRAIPQAVLAALTLGTAVAARADCFDSHCAEVKQKLLANAVSLAILANYEMTAEPYVGKVQRGEGEDLFTLRFAPGKTHVVTAVCDRDCPDIDTALYDAKGRLVASDTRDDKIPMVAVPPTSGEDYYLLKTSIPGCRANRCTFGVGVFGEKFGQLDTEGLAKLLVTQPEGFWLVDARNASDFEQGHIPGAISIPHNAIDANAAKLPRSAGAPIVLYCWNRDCGMRHTVAQALKDAGYRSISPASQVARNAPRASRRPARPWS